MRLEHSMNTVRHLRANKTPPSPAASIAKAYDLAGDEYLAYADGNADGQLSFTGKYAYADGHVWTHIEDMLVSLRDSGADTVRILDAGCGPGTWTCRVIRRARELGFKRIVARGFDLSGAQIQQAKTFARELGAESGIAVEFNVGNLTDRLQEADASVDLTLCLYSVLSHIPVAEQPQVISELARVTRGKLITTVRAVGSMPSGIVADIEDVQRLRLDHRRDWYEVELNGGRKAEFSFHLFKSVELTQLFSRAFKVELIEGLDFFHHRFAGDQRWNPRNLEFSKSLVNTLSALEEMFLMNPEYIDHANHLLLIARR
jgi:SAM-dependent methyltransferase